MKIYVLTIGDRYQVYETHYYSTYKKAEDGMNEKKKKMRDPEDYIFRITEEFVE